MNYKEIEKKWQKYWDDNKSFVADEDEKKEKYYYLIEFPFPSGDGLHVGHVRSYTALDVMARKKRLLGYNVLYPIGWDAFGLPTEQYAIKNKVHPSLAATNNVNNFKKQIKSLGISFDWSREINTTDPEYYKWTQWQFLKFFEHGMAYKDKKEINWCPNCKIGLSNEESSGNICERCGHVVEKKMKEQWMLKMSDYSEQLLQGLEKTNFIDRVSNSQINWIGKSVGASINFNISGTNEILEDFTTRVDTIYGVTYLCLSPEHSSLEKLKDIILNYDEILEYRRQASTKTIIERTDNTKEKTGIKVEGVKAINPLSKEEISIWVSDYVLNNYATGAIMGVPAHDSRDYAFAKKYDLPIVQVLAKDGFDISTGAMMEDGVLINSPLINGLNKTEAITKMISYVEEHEMGKAKVNYKLADWVFSRQRFWGEPIPMVKCDCCGYVPVKEEDLPVSLPNVESFEPTDDGESPLSKIDEFVNTICPACGRPAKRETDVMPNWAGSSWYYLRYMDPKNIKDFASTKAMKYWGMVDFYNGGMEHATRHLLYARFWHRFMYNIGLVPHEEPFNRRVAHGMILGSDGEKMSKSKGNVINPNKTIEEYSADILRLYEMFIGDYEQDCLWNDNGLKGCKRFVEKVIKLKDKLTDDKINPSLEILLNQTIKKVTLDIENMKFNTAISALMILVNKLEEGLVNKNVYKILLVLLNPFAPHITEELNEQVFKDVKICDGVWPLYDEEKTIESTYELVVQVNGKVRGKIVVDTNLDEQEVLELAINIENVKLNIENKQIIKRVIIKGKLINFVVK